MPLNRPAPREAHGRTPARRPFVQPAPSAGSDDLEERLRRAERFGHSLADFRRRSSLPPAAHPGEEAPPEPLSEPASPERAAGAPSSAPVQAKFGWKKKLLTGLGVVGGAAALTAGVLTGGLGLAVGGGLALLAGGLYGAYQHRQARRERERERQYQERQSQPIPDNMHFVWLGGRVPPGRQENIQSWGREARGVTPHLWLDESSAEASHHDIPGLTGSGVQIRGLSELEAGNPRFREARESLPTRDGGRVNPGVAGAVSDIARLEILHREGGHYMDSDNTPGPDAARFAGMTAPLGFRLGWGRLERSETFSNDAMSANPGNRFIASYLDSSYRNLTPQRIADIRSRETERVKSGVMETTGPSAMAHVPFPLPEDRAAGVLREASGVITALEDESNAERGTMGARPTNVGISLFPSNREYGGGRFSDQVGSVHQDVAYSGSLFNRGLGNSWVPAAQPGGDAESSRREEPESSRARAAEEEEEKRPLI